MTRDTSLPPANEGFADVVARLAAAQKRRAPGAPAYSIYVNRPFGRLLAAAAFLAGLTPNAVTAISAIFTFSAIVVIALVPPAPVIGVVVGLLLIVGYALDSADGQVARLRGGGSPAGEWLDHVVDAAKLSSLHLAVLVGWFRFVELPSPALLLIPLGYAIVAAVTFFAMIINDFLRTRDRVAAPTRPAGGGIRSLMVLPTDYGILCLAFLLFGVPVVFVPLYGLLFVANAAFALVALPKWFREISRIPR
jgi:phosphatidylglycerophosphate synthase